MDNLELKSLRMIAVPIAMISVMVILYLVSFKVAFSNIAKTRDRYDELQQINETLEQKKVVLLNSQGVVGQYTQDLLYAFPESNPSLAVVLSARDKAREYGLSVKEISIIPAKNYEKLDYSKVDIKVSVSGTFDNMLNFVKSLRSSSPLIRLEEVDFVDTGDEINFSFVASSFWAPLPESLPSITANTTELTEEEELLMNELSSLDRDENSINRTTLSPTDPKDRIEPFSL